MILKCGCVRGGPVIHEVGSDGKPTGRMTIPVASPLAARFQDERYGVGMRVHVPTKAGRDGGYRCTVCGKDR